MASASQTAVARPFPTLTGRGGLIDKYFYLAMSLLLVAITVWGFGHTVNDVLFRPAVPRPLLLWIHAAVFCSWLLLFVLQTALVRTHHVHWHRTLGWFVAGVGAAMIPLGVVVAIVMGRFDTRILHQAGADTFEFISFGDMAIFAVLLSLGIVWRKKPALHRPIFFIATCGLIGAAFGRVPFIASHLLMYVCVDAVICLGILRDLLVNRGIHRVYLIALPVLAVAQYGIVYMITTPPQWWIRIAHSMMG
jgi:drug/metabolite transporter (DMT)-like permease